MNTTKIKSWLKTNSKNVISGIIGIFIIIIVLVNHLNTNQCNVARFYIRGEITDYAYIAEANSVPGSELMADLIDAFSNPSIKLVLLEINSYGGSVIAGKEVSDIIKLYDTPSLSYIRGAGTSSAYWIASATDYIIANEVSDVGGIGVTASFLDEANLNIKEGYNYNQLSSGRFKDMGSVEKPLTYEERMIIMRDVKVIHNIFVNSVAESRGIEVNKVKKLSDGSSMLGKMALDNGLVDEVGDYNQVYDVITNTIGNKLKYCDFYYNNSEVE